MRPTKRGRPRKGEQAAGSNVVNVRLPNELRKKLQVHADRLGVLPNFIMKDAIEMLLNAGGQGVQLLDEKDGNRVCRYVEPEHQCAESLKSVILTKGYNGDLLASRLVVEALKQRRLSFAQSAQGQRSMFPSRGDADTAPSVYKTAADILDVVIEELNPDGVEPEDGES